MIFNSGDHHNMIWTLHHFARVEVRGDHVYYKFTWDNRGFSWSIPLSAVYCPEDFEHLSGLEYSHAAFEILRSL